MVKLKVVKKWVKPSGIEIKAGTVLEVKDESAAKLLADYPGTFKVVDNDSSEQESEKRD